MWRAKRGEYYYSYDCVGDIIRNKENWDLVDEELFYNFNYFQTKELAKEYMLSQYGKRAEIEQWYYFIDFTDKYSPQVKSKREEHSEEDFKRYIGRNYYVNKLNAYNDINRYLNMLLEYYRNNY